MEWRDSRSTRDAGESPLFPPDCDDAEEARQKILSIIATPPDELGHERSRWRLQDLCLEVDWGDELTEGGMSQLLSELGITYGRGRQYTESPDEKFDEKRNYIKRMADRVETRSDTILMYLDELSYYHHPAKARDWNESGERKTVERPPTSKYETSHRVLAAMNAETGELHYKHRAEMGCEPYLSFLSELDRSYEEASEVIVVLDNCPMHFHVDVMDSLQQQRWPFDFIFPPTWTDPNPAANRSGNVGIQLTPLPTYASWLNPIEQLWHWIRKDVLNMHTLADDWEEVKQRVDDFLGGFAETPSPELLEYTGLNRRLNF